MCYTLGLKKDASQSPPVVQNHILVYRFNRRKISGKSGKCALSSFVACVYNRSKYAVLGGLFSGYWGYSLLPVIEHSVIFQRMHPFKSLSPSINGVISLNRI